MVRAQRDDAQAETSIGAVGFSADGSGLASASGGEQLLAGVGSIVFHSVAQIGQWLTGGYNERPEAPFWNPSDLTNSTTSFWGEICRGLSPSALKNQEALENLGRRIRQIGRRTGLEVVSDNDAVESVGFGGKKYNVYYFNGINGYDHLGNPIAPGPGWFLAIGTDGVGWKCSGPCKIPSPASTPNSDPPVPKGEAESAWSDYVLCNDPVFGPGACSVTKTADDLTFEVNTITAITDRMKAHVKSLKDQLNAEKTNLEDYQINGERTGKYLDVIMVDEQKINDYTNNIDAIQSEIDATQKEITKLNNDKGKVESQRGVKDSLDELQAAQEFKEDLEQGKIPSENEISRELCRQIIELEAELQKNSGDGFIFYIPDFFNDIVGKLEGLKSDLSGKTSTECQALLGTVDKAIGDISLLFDADVPITEFIAQRLRDYLEGLKSLDSSELSQLEANNFDFAAANEKLGDPLFAEVQRGIAEQLRKIKELKSKLQDPLREADKRIDKLKDKLNKAKKQHIDRCVNSSKEPPSGEPTVGPGESSTATPTTEPNTGKDKAKWDLFYRIMSYAPEGAVVGLVAWWAYEGAAYLFSKAFTDAQRSNGLLYSEEAAQEKKLELENEAASTGKAYAILARSYLEEYVQQHSDYEYQSNLSGTFQTARATENWAITCLPANRDLFHDLTADWNTLSPDQQKVKITSAIEEFNRAQGDTKKGNIAKQILCFLGLFLPNDNYTTFTDNLKSGSNVLTQEQWNALNDGFGNCFKVLSKKQSQAMRLFLKDSKDSNNQEQIKTIVLKRANIRQAQENLKKEGTTFNGISISATLDTFLTVETLLGLIYNYKVAGEPSLVGVGQFALTLRAIRLLWPYITGALNSGYPYLRTLCRFICECMMGIEKPLHPDRVKAILLTGDSASADASTSPKNNDDVVAPADAVAPASAVTTAMPRATIFSYAHII